MCPPPGSNRNKANSGATSDNVSFTQSIDKASPTVKVLYTHERRISELVNTVNQLVDAVDALNQHHVHYETRIEALEQNWNQQITTNLMPILIALYEANRLEDLVLKPKIASH